MWIRNYFRNLFTLHLPEGKVRDEAYREINQCLLRAFHLPLLKTYINTLSTRSLLEKAVEMFVGSQSCPKNGQLSKNLLEFAEEKSTNQKQLDEIQYYRYYFLRLGAFKSGNQLQFELSTEMINRLAEQKEHPQSCYLVGKQLYNMGETATSEKQMKEFFKLSAYYFEKSLTQNQYGGLFYIGQILRNQQLTHAQEQEIREIFTYGAALGDPLSYFRLSQVYRLEENNKLSLKYLKLAAEAGVLEAQHNLGCEYQEGKRMKQDEVKALSWFIQASAHGFIYSKYNVVDIFLQGSKCGRIKVNKKAALLTLQELKQLGENVDNKIKQVLESEQIKQTLSI